MESEEKQRETLNKIESLTSEQLSNSDKSVSKQDVFYRLQEGSHGGCSVFFNPNGTDTRFGVNDGINGTMYVAKDPLTAIKEVFQKNTFLTETDLDKYHMGTVSFDKDLSLVEMRNLHKQTSLTVNDVTTSDRKVTQALAKKVHEEGKDGIIFTSNVSGEECLVVWSSPGNGQGFAKTIEQTKLSEFEWNGESAEDILVYKLGISVEEG